MIDNWCSGPGLVAALVTVRNSQGGGRDRHRKQDAEEPRELGADDERENDKERRNADYLLHDQRDDEVILELLDDEIKAGHRERGREPRRCEECPRCIGDGDTRNGGDDRAEERYGLEDSRERGEEQRVLHAEHRKAEIDEDPDEHCKEYLPLYPEADLLLSAPPERDDIRLMLLRRDDAKERGDSVFLHRKVEREHQD